MTATPALTRESEKTFPRLHALDTELLWLEDADSPMCIGALCVFEGPVPSRDECERFVSARLDAAPLFRKCVRTVPFGLGRPVLLDDARFDITYHMRRATVSAPSREAALWELTGTLLSTRLDRQRPLWQMYVIDGLPDGRWALLTKAHHALVDGIADIGVLTSLLSPQPDVLPIESATWQPSAPPSGLALVKDALAGAREDAETWAMELRGAWQHRRVTKVRARELGHGLSRYVRRVFESKTSSLQGNVHARRRYASIAVQLADVCSIRDAFQCTTDAVVLTLLSSGYRAMLECRGDDLRRARLRALVPTALALPEVDGLEGKRVSALFCELPVDTESARARLDVVAQRLKEAERSHTVEAGAWLGELADLAPPFVMRAVSRAVARGMHWRPQKSVATVVTSVSGPTAPRYFRGRRMLSWSPYVPITQGARIGSAALSYNGALRIGITADHDSVQHLGLFARAIQVDLASLLTAARATASVQG